MTYNNTVELIKAVAEPLLPSGTFIHGRRIDGSIIFDKPFPQIHLLPFTTTKIRRPERFDNSELLIGFWFQDKPDSTVEERQEIIDKADVMCNLFIEALEARVSSVTLSAVQIENVRTEPQYYHNMATASGYALRFNLISQSQITCP